MNLGFSPGGELMADALESASGEFRFSETGFDLLRVVAARVHAIPRLERACVIRGVPREQKMLKGHQPRVISPSILVYED